MNRTWHDRKQKFHVRCPGLDEMAVDGHHFNLCGDFLNCCLFFRTKDSARINTLNFDFGKSQTRYLSFFKLGEHSNLIYAVKGFKIEFGIPVYLKSSFDPKLTK